MLYGAKVETDTGTRMLLIDAQDEGEALDAIRQSLGEFGAVWIVNPVDLLAEQYCGIAELATL